jgi:energy-coupling factor transporter ATP-binding protein EcfA2
MKSLQMNYTPFDNFVASEDRPRLLDIVRKVKNGTLKDDCSVLVIYGTSNSGKSTLCRILNEISTYSRNLPHEFFSQRIGWSRYWNSTGTFFVHDFDSNKALDIIGTNDKLPEVLVIMADSDPTGYTNTRKMMTLHLPFVFRNIVFTSFGDVIFESCVEYARKNL